MDGMSVLLVGGFGIEGIASLDDIEPGTGGFVGRTALCRIR